MDVPSDIFSTPDYSAYVPDPALDPAPIDSAPPPTLNVDPATDVPAPDTTGGAGAAVGPTSGLDALLKQLGNVVKTNGTYDLGKLATLAAGLYSASKSNTMTHPVGYQGGIPNLVATRNAPGPDGKLSGNVTYRLAGTAPTGASGGINPNAGMAAGGSLESGGFVIPADVVSHLGNGSSEAGLRILADRLGATPIKGHGDGMSDSIKTTIDGHQPARVANEEARLTKQQVDAAGGAKKLYAMMDQIRHARTGSKKQGKQIDPSKFVPGGSVSGYATGGTTDSAPGATLPTGITGTEQGIASWAGPYVTNMLAQGNALADMPYQQYGGPLTAGASPLQTQAFNTAGNLQTPSSIGQAADTAGGIASAANGLKYNPVGTTFGTEQAQQYMNPYLQSALNPQLDEMRRQSQANLQPNMAQLTKAGGYGGGRQAIMESEANRNLLSEQDKLVGQGYSNAYDKAMNQFNTDQQRQVQENQFGANYGLQGLQTGLQAAQAQGALGTQENQANLANLTEQGALGAQQRGIASEDIAAQKAQFDAAQLNPYKMVQFKQSLLSGLPLAAQTYNQAPTNDLTQFAGGAKSVSDLLKSLGVTPTA